MKITMKTKISTFLPHLNEKQLRQYLASEAAYLGFGGVTKISKISGKSRPTIIQGKKELFEKPSTDTYKRVRKKGGGRKSVKEKNPGILKELESLIEPLTRGDPMSPLRWTCKSTRKLAAALREKNYKVSHVVVAAMLKKLGYSLQSNAKIHEGGKHPDRNDQFEYINTITKNHLMEKQPVISVDTKKKELVGNYKNNGQEWRPVGEPIGVNVYDFIDETKGKAVPYGIYDIGRNEGFVNVGTSFDTSAFAVSSIRRWWEYMGHKKYSKAKKLVITADCGGSNGNRRKLWKTELQKLSNETKLEITVCHLPPGTSKWNKIEHRLFSYITMNWRSKPLESYETIVNLIGSTTTEKGLKIKSLLDTEEYEKGLSVPDSELRAVNIFPHIFHGEWNYTIKPK